MPGSVRTVEVAYNSTEIQAASSKAFTLPELIGTIPFAYQARLGDYLTKKYRIMHKYANVQSTITLYERHIDDCSFPPIIRNALKEPRLQFAKEFLATTKGTAAPETFKAQVAAARKSVLLAAIQQKKDELAHLSSLIKPEPDKWKEACKMVAKHAAESNGGRATETADKVKFTGLPPSAIEEYDGIVGGCEEYTYRILAIARSAIDRAEIQKLSKLKLKETTDVEMTDGDSKDLATRDIIREELKAFRQELSQATRKSKNPGRVQKNTSGKKAKAKGGNKKKGKGKKSQ